MTNAFVTAFNYKYSLWAAELINAIKPMFDTTICIIVDTVALDSCTRVLMAQNASLLGIPLGLSTYNDPHWMKLHLLSHTFREFDTVWFFDADQKVLNADKTLPNVHPAFGTTRLPPVALVYDVSDAHGRYREFNLDANSQHRTCRNATRFKQEYPLNLDRNRVYLSNIVVVRPHALPQTPEQYVQRTREFFEVHGECNRQHDQTLFHVLFWNTFGFIRQPRWLRHYFHVRCHLDESKRCKV